MVAPEPTPPPGRPRVSKRRRARKVVEVAHRWTAFGFGIALLLVVLSGVVLTFAPEIDHWKNGSKYDTQPTHHPISIRKVLATVKRERPDFGSQDVVLDDGVYFVYSKDHHRRAFVDPASGEFLGVINEDTGFMGLMRNIHLCALACKEYPGYVSFLDHRVEDSFVPAFGNDNLTWGTLILAVLGLLLIFLCLCGIWLWWPSIKRFGRGFRIRRGSNYKLTYDLHKLIGIVSIPFLLMWGWTGAGFELKQLEDAWYLVMPGDKIVGGHKPLESNPQAKRVFEPEARDGKVNFAEARAIGQRVAGPDARFVSVLAPAAYARQFLGQMAGRKGSYSMWFSRGSNPYEYGELPANLRIVVDRYSGRHEITYPLDPTDRPLGRTIWEDWNFGVHAGTFANTGWRIFWGVFGLAVLLLAVTSTITWSIRWRRKRTKGKGAGRRLQAEASE
jgi:uncharacterized iron-regulated membrane protein